MSVERRDPSIYEHALEHLAHVNGWDLEHVRSYLAETAETFQRREALGPWAQDFSLLLNPNEPLR